jgi:hypothetical protein
MFREIQGAFSKFFTGQKIIIFIILLILAFAIMTYSNSKSFRFDSMEDGTGTGTGQGIESGSGQGPTESVPMTQGGNMTQPMGNSNLQSVANPSDLLPQDKNSQWATLNPTLNPNNVIIPDLLEAGYHIGLDTIGQTLRNANLQLRSDPIIPKRDVSPWNNSTMEANMQTPLELGVR